MSAVIFRVRTTYKAHYVTNLGTGKRRVISRRLYMDFVTEIKQAVAAAANVPVELVSTGGDDSHGIYFVVPGRPQAGTAQVHS